MDLIDTKGGCAKNQGRRRISLSQLGTCEEYFHSFVSHGKKTMQVTKKGVAIMRSWINLGSN